MSMIAIDDRKFAHDIGVDTARIGREAAQAERSVTERSADQACRSNHGGVDEQRDFWGDLEGYACKTCGRFRSVG
jgi:hypothetical protein